MDNLLVQILLLAIAIAAIEFIVPAGGPQGGFSPRRAVQGVCILLFLLYKLGFSGHVFNRHAMHDSIKLPVATKVA